jgi:hypothetical protein
MRSSTTQNKHQGPAEVSIVSHSKGPPISNLRPEARGFTSMPPPNSNLYFFLPNTTKLPSCPFIT